MGDVVLHKNVEATMRDGTVLRADVFRPDDGERHPVLLLRTPYDKEMLHLMAPLLSPTMAAAAGYVVVLQDVRGRFASDGDGFYPVRDELADGYDAIEWAASLPWSNGTVGTYGLSYMGMTSWQAAAAGHPALRAFQAAKSPGRNMFWRGGALQWGALARWAMWAIGPNNLERALGPGDDLHKAFEALLDANDDFAEWTAHLPLAEFPPGRPGDDAYQPFFFDAFEHDRRADLADMLASPTGSDYSQIKAPGLILAGWADVLLGADLEHYRRIRTEAATAEAREGTKLVIGPWWHGMFRGVVGMRDFGFRATGVLDLAAEPGPPSLMGDFTWFVRRWFDHWLTGADNGVADEPRVRIFVQGVNRWRGEDDWPLARAVSTPWYLRADGRLTPEAPGADERSGSYVYDPQDPCPTAGGTLLMTDAYARGPVDQRPIMARADVLSYISDPLDQPLEVTGPVTARLHAATSAPATDWVVKLCDVHPDGRVFNMADGILRSTYRGPDEPHAPAAAPGQPAAYEVDMWATSNVFLPGHRIAVLVTSSDFPRYDRNPNTGERPTEAATTVAAQQTIFHDGMRASHVVLPVVPNADFGAEFTTERGR